MVFDNDNEFGSILTMDYFFLWILIQYGLFRAGHSPLACPFGLRL